MRKAFNFYNSYYEVAKELNDKDRLAFLDALLLREFTGKEIELKGMAKFAYLSQKHSIDLQVKGYFDKTKDPYFDPCQGGSVGGLKGGSVQEKEKEKEKEKEQYTKAESDKELISKFTNWFNKMYLDVKGKETKYKTMTPTDLNNYKKLKAVYEREDFVKVFKCMLQNPWVKEHNKGTIDHFLRNDNFVKYLNTDLEEDVKPKYRAPWQQ